MLLALDIGNTNIHLGVFHEKELIANWNISNDRSRRTDELGIMFKLLLRDSGIEPKEIEGAVVACVVPQVSSLVSESLKRHFGLDPFFVGPDTDKDLLTLFDDPQEVGADRIANAIGGYQKYGGPLIIVDFGTATTFDAVSGEGVYLGGSIAPGIAISIEALFRKAAKLPRIEMVCPGKAVGTNTISSMQAGIIFGYAGLVDSLVRRIRGEIGEEATVVATGGMAELIVRETGIVQNVDEHLTLEGLRILYENSITR